MTLRPFRLELGDGEFLVGDELAGASPPWLFLHGLGSVRVGAKSASLLEHAARSGRGFLRIDLRGHGESSGRLGQVMVSALIDDVVRVLDHCGPAAIAGSSLGGLVGAYAAAARPDRVRCLVLLAPALGLLGNLAARLDARGRLWTSDGTAFTVAPEVLADARRLDEAGLPGRLTMPTLVVHGEADDVVPWQASQRFHAAIASSRKELWIVPAGDHRLGAAADEAWRRADALLRSP